MSDMIRVQPESSRRVAFARWAVAQRPKPRTVSPDAFAVPPHLFVDAPEDILIGALVDGHRYVSPDEDAAQGGPAPGGPDLLGVATPQGLTSPPVPERRTATPVEALPEVPAETHGPAPVLPPDDDPTDDGDSDGDGTFPCDACGRPFTTERGRDTHRRAKHPEG